MIRIEVILEIEQCAVVVVEVADEYDKHDVRRAALAALDESGGAEWRITSAAEYWTRC